jgi:hypothetical protein
MKKMRFSCWTAAWAALAFLSFTPSRVLAHCDTLNGPVVNAARHALSSSNVNPVFMWIREQDEPEIKRVFNHTLRVRSLSPEAAELADQFFFETVVRIHRAGEGAPYSGLKSIEHAEAGAIAVADEALQTGNADALIKMLSSGMEKTLRKHFAEVMAKKNFDTNDVQAARAFVKAYVEYTHQVEAFENAASEHRALHSAPTSHNEEREHHGGTGAFPDPGMTGYWNGNARIIVSWCAQTNLHVAVTIHNDGTVTGAIGDALLEDGHLKRNRGWLGRKLHLKTDYIITGKLTGPIIAQEKITRSAVSVPLNFTQGTFRGGVHTSGTHVGGKRTMVLSAAPLTLTRTNQEPQR